MGHDLREFLGGHEFAHHVFPEYGAKPDPALGLVPGLFEVVIHVPGHEIVEAEAGFGAPGLRESIDDRLHGLPGQSDRKVAQHDAVAGECRHAQHLLAVRGNVDHWRRCRHPPRVVAADTEKLAVIRERTGRSRTLDDIDCLTDCSNASGPIDFQRHYDFPARTEDYLGPAGTYLVQRQ